MNPFIFFLSLLLVYFVSILMHEIGHIVAFRHYGKKVKLFYEDKSIVVGKEEDYKGLNKDQLQDIYISGVISGFAFILLVTILEGSIYLVLLFPYIWGSREDILNYARLE